MTRLARRIGLIGLCAALAFAALTAAWFWYLGNDLITRGRSAGWVAAESASPLTLFEKTVVGANFSKSWNRTSFPCRSLTGASTPMPVSAFVARDIQMELAPVRTLEASLTRVSAACQLEASHSDKALLRLWLDRFRLADHVGMDSIARKLFGKPTADLGETESARLAALLEAPSLWRATPEKWSERAGDVIDRAGAYEWVGDVLEPKGAHP